MNVMRIAGPIGIALTVLASAAPDGLRKELIVLRVDTQSRTPAQARLITRGLIHLESGATARQPWQVIRTVSVPGVVTFGGIGEADIASVDSTIALVVEVKQTVRNPPAVRRVVGPAFRISRNSQTEAFRVTPLTHWPQHSLQ